MYVYFLVFNVIMLLIEIRVFASDYRYTVTLPFDSMHYHLSNARFNNTSRRFQTELLKSPRDVARMSVITKNILAILSFLQCFVNMGHRSGFYQHMFTLSYLALAMLGKI